jgi:hypothetical protein
MATLKFDDKVVLAGSAFAAGLAVGLFAKDAAKQVYETVRDAGRHRQSERVVSYGDNLPEQLERREPAGEQPRYGGTGALGVSPAVVAATRPDQT